MPIRFIVNNSNNNNNAGWEREKVYGYKTNKKTFEKPTKENVKYKPNNLKTGALLISYYVRDNIMPYTFYV